MGKIVKLKNANDVYTYPVTKTEAVYLEDNKTTLKDYLDAMAITKTAGPAQVITFNDGADNVPVKSLILNIKPRQEGTGDPSPTNIRPITGYDEINIVRRGDNLIDRSTMTNNTPFYSSQSGNISSGSSSIWVKNEIMIKPNTIYSIVFSGSGNVRIAYEDNNHTFISRQVTTVVLKMTSPSAATYMQVAVDTDITNLSIVENGDLDTYVPFTGYDAYQITIPSAAGTVYGGTLDATNGILTVTHEYKTLDAAFFSGGGTSTTNNIRRFYTATTFPNTYSNIIMCDRLIVDVDTVGQVNIGYAFIMSNGTRFAVTPSWGQELTTLSAFTATLTENPINCIFTLTNPIVYTLTFSQITTLLSDNTIQMDADGTLQLTYKADLATYIANAISSSNS